MSEAFPPVRELVPQRPPMLLLDAVTRQEGDTIACAAELRADNLFVREGRAPAALALEYMAQAIAALHGLRARARGEAVRVGLLVGCRALQLHADWLRVGDALQVQARRAFADGALAEYSASVTRGDELVAEAVLHVTLAEMEAQPA